MDSHSCGFLLGSQKVVSKLEIVDFLYLFPFPCFPCPLWQTLRKGKNSLRVNLIEQLQCRLCIQWVLNKAYFPLSSVSESLLQVSVLLLMRSFGKWFLQQVPLKNSCYFKRSSLSGERSISLACLVQQNFAHDIECILLESKLFSLFSSIQKVIMHFSHK